MAGPSVKQQIASLANEIFPFMCLAEGASQLVQLFNAANIKTFAATGEKMKHRRPLYVKAADGT